MTTNTCPNLTNLPLPAGHTGLGSWQRKTGTGLWFRRFAGQCRMVELPDNTDHDAVAATGLVIYVRVAGEQYADGRILSWVSLEEAAAPLTAAQARSLARALVAAAEEIAEAQHDDETAVGSCCV